LIIEEDYALSGGTNRGTDRKESRYDYFFSYLLVGFLFFFMGLG